MNTNNIVDLSEVSPQQTFLMSHPETPKSTSTLYLDRFTTGESGKPQDHTVVGVHVVFAKGNPNGLWEIFHVDREKQKLDPENPKMATNSLQICCDTLEVHGELSVPEADVAIFARRLIWATPDAAINTSPLEWTVSHAQNASEGSPGKDGKPGPKAGTFKLFVSQVEPANDSRPRLIAKGGNGQDAGEGAPGKDGSSLTEWWTELEWPLRISKDSWDRLFPVSHPYFIDEPFRMSFNPPAFKIVCKHMLGTLKTGEMKIGHNIFPDDGTDALAPGVPGDGGDGGDLITNLTAIKPIFVNIGGKAGCMAHPEKSKGGSHGNPQKCATYTWKRFQRHPRRFVKEKEDYWGRSEVIPGRIVETKDGNSIEPKKNPNGKDYGNTPELELVSESNAWLHPLSIQKALEYARDLFLAEDRIGVENLLYAYERSLALPMPINKYSPWDDSSIAYWTAAQSEVASMLQRLRGHLDYFGNPAGYTPFLSLQGTIKLYAEETKRALRMLLLVGWIDAKERNSKNVTEALGKAIDDLNEDTLQAATQVTSSEAKIRGVMKRMDTLEKELKGMSNELEILEQDLLGKAEMDLKRQAYIKASIKMAAAVCQVVPVYQPILGTVGSLASVATGFIGDDGTKAPDTVSKMVKVISDAREAAKKANETSKKAEMEKEKDKEKDAKVNASAWAQVGNGLGPALSQVSQGLKALQVPESEVEAELQLLESQSKEWNELVKHISDLNEGKVTLFRDLEDALQSLGEGYARISTNSSAIFSMQQERKKEIVKLDPIATGFVKQMGQRSRLTLLWYMYLMVKAYETTVLKPINVDWKLTEITEKINKLLEPDKGFDATLLNQQVDALEPLYQENLREVRNQLLKDFSFNESTITLQLGLSSQQTPDIMTILNNAGQVVIDPMSLGLVLPDYQLARLSDVKLKKIEFDPGPSLPETDNVRISLEPSHNGTIRRSEALYSVHSDSPLNWSWTYASGEVHASEPSKGSEDILNLVLGDGAEKIKQKISLPPLWSDLAIKVSYPPQSLKNQRPRISRLYFELSCDVTSAPYYQRVVNVQSLGTTGGAIIECSPPT